MTDSSEDGNYLVRVRAQVMCRDDNSGGWVPLGGGGLSNVSVRKKPRPASASGPPGSDSSAKPKHDYLIYGKRISDQSVVLSCTIKKDFEYNKVMPTFHHWKTGEKKFGLTFQTAADARAFDKGVRTAVEELLDGFSQTSPISPFAKLPKEVGDDDVFMTLNLPQEPKDSRSSSDSSTKGADYLHRITYISREKPQPEIHQPVFDPLKSVKGEKIKPENYSYVQLKEIHEYTYPIVEEQKPTTHKRDLDPKLSTKRRSPSNCVCKHCNAIYVPELNDKGSCEFAPDCFKSAVDAITCIECAKCVCYHCASDAEGDFTAHPCDCGQDENCAKRWVCLAFLSIFVPCLCLYPPLKVCHMCGIGLGVCGGRHSM